MKFGQVKDPGAIDFSLPEDHEDTAGILNTFNEDKPFEVYVGCAKWNKQDLKGFYPRGTKDELTYYASRFNAIELNATFYRAPGKQQVLTWASKTPDGFKFFPKIPSRISHIKRLNEVKQPVLEFCDALYGFEEKLGMVFLQMHNNFQPKDFDRLQEFVENFPEDIPLALELRNPDWFKDQDVYNDYCRLLEEHRRTNIIVDTAGRRDLLHMRLTSDSAFIRYVGANHESDYNRLDDWIERVVKWRSQGLKNLYFFVHQNIEKESPLLSAYFIEKVNMACNLHLKRPVPDDNPLGI
ncbi:MAG: DUF72 domain-containing protein [Balneolales bacterium]